MSLASRTTALKNIVPLASKTLIGAQTGSLTEERAALMQRQKEWREEFEMKAQNAAAPKKETTTEANEAVDGVTYNVWIGAPFKMYSSAASEAATLKMRRENHWDLPISRAAARVADFLWPDCQTVVDEAVAKSKVMKNTRGIEPDEVYMAPKIPEFLPITHWVSTNKRITSSFVSDKTTIVRPRMSWYNPNDGMVPCGWLQQGLIADLAYYQPFSAPSNK